MLSSTDAIDLIIDERMYQDSTFVADEVLSSGITREVRDRDVTPHLVLLDQYVEKAKAAWVPKGSNLAALQQIAKIAAIAMRALENCGGSEKLLEAGLR